MSCTNVCASNEIEYKGNGSQVLYTFPFTYLKSTDVYVDIYDETTQGWARAAAPYTWTFANATTIEFAEAPPTPTETGVFNIKIARCTDIDPLIAQFNPGSAIRAADLNDNFEQLQLAIQEGRCQDIASATDLGSIRVGNNLVINPTDGVLSAVLPPGVSYKGDWNDPDNAPTPAVSGDFYIWNGGVAALNNTNWGTSNGQEIRNNDRLFYDGTTWDIVPGGYGLINVSSTSDTPPADPIDGDLWWDSTDGALYVYYEDVNSSQWVSATPQPSYETPSITGVAPITVNSTDINNPVIGFDDTALSMSSLDYTYPGGVEQTVQQRLEQYISVKDFGAVGDGVTDDTAAIQASLVGYPDDPSTGRTVFFPEGTYRVTNTITVPDDCELVGANKMKTIISFEKADATMFVYVARVNNLPVGRFQIRHLTLDANQNSPAMGTATAVSCTQMHGSHFTDFQITRFKTGLYLNTCYMCQFTSFYFRGYASAYDGTINAFAGLGTRHCTFQGGIFNNIGTDFSGFDNIILSDIDCEPSMSPVIIGRESLVTRCRFERMNMNWGTETTSWILIDGDNNQFIDNYLGQNGGTNLQTGQYLIKVNGSFNTVSLGPSFSWRSTKAVNFVAGSKGNKLLVESQMKAYQATDGNSQFIVSYEPVVVDTDQESYIEYDGNKGGGNTLRVLRASSDANLNYDNITSSGIWENLLTYTDDVVTNVNAGDITSSFLNPTTFTLPEWAADPYVDASVFNGTWQQISGNNECGLDFDVTYAVDVEGTYTLMFLSRSYSNIFSRVIVIRDGSTLSMGSSSDIYNDGAWRYHSLQVYLLAGDTVDFVRIGQKPAGGVDPSAATFYMAKPSFCYGLSAPYIATGASRARKTF